MRTPATFTPHRSPFSSLPFLMPIPHSGGYGFQISMDLLVEEININILNKEKQQRPTIPSLTIWSVSNHYTHPSSWGTLPSLKTSVRLVLRHAYRSRLRTAVLTWRRA